MKRRQPDNVKGYVCVANRKLLSTSHGDSFGIHGWLSPPKPCTSLVQSYPQLAWWNGSLQRATNAVRDQADRPNKLRLNTFTHLPTIVHGTRLFDVHLSSFIPPHYPHSFLNVQRCSKHSNRIPNMPWVMRHALRLWRIPSRECQALQYARWVGASSRRTSLQSEWIRQIWRNSGGQDIASELTWSIYINLQ